MGVTTETLLSKPIKLVIDDANYWPGMGLITGFVLLFVVGLAVNAFLVRRFLSIGEELLLRVPVVKTVYSAIRDMTRLVNTDKKKGDLDRVVTLDLGFGRLIGFVTQEHANTLGIGGGEDLVAVYLPMSYQIGGYTVYLPRSRVVETDSHGGAGDAHRADGRRARGAQLPEVPASGAGQGVCVFGRVQAETRLPLPGLQPQPVAWSGRREVRLHEPPRILAPNLEIGGHDLALAIGPRVIEMQADERVARLDALHAATFESLAELAIEPTVSQALVEAVDRQHFLAPRR